MTWLRRTKDRLLDGSVFASFDASGFRRHAQRFAPGDLDVRLDDRVVLITGGNGGLGMATARGLGARGATVYLACRNPHKGEAARDRLRTELDSDRIHCLRLDVSTRATVDAARSHLPPRVDVLIHNAGILPAERCLTDDGLESTLATNLVGPHRLTWHLRNALSASPAPRIILVSSGGMYLQSLRVDQLDNLSGRFDGATAYARTKRAQVVLAGLLQTRLGAPAWVGSMHPGWADTGGVQRQMPRFYRLMKKRLRTPAEGADTTVWMAAKEPPPSPPGAFWFDRRAVDPNALPGTGTDTDEAERLWSQLCAWADVPTTGWGLAAANRPQVPR